MHNLSLFRSELQNIKQGVNMIKTVTEDTFDKAVLKSDKPVLVDLWAEWCAPCRAMEPAIEDVAKQFEGKLEVAKLNVDENPALAQKLGVMSIPTMMVFKGGQPVSRWVGASSKDRLVGAVSAAIA
jgi:thioredoxin 1